MSMLKKAFGLVQFFPLLIFMYAFTYFMSWEAAFEIAGIVAAVIVGFLFIARITMDNFMLGTSLFLVLGAVMFLFNVVALEYLYGFYMEAMLFASILFVGIVTTFFSSTGFIGVAGEAVQVRRASIYLLLGVVVAGVLAILLHGDVLNGFVIPWFIVLSLRHVLR